MRFSIPSHHTVWKFSLLILPDFAKYFRVVCSPVRVVSFFSVKITGDLLYVVFQLKHFKGNVAINEVLHLNVSMVRTFGQSVYKISHEFGVCAVS